jgi:succinate dehydrogenase / fumarate reductase iron-sulfur subunit
MLVRLQVERFDPGLGERSLQLYELEAPERSTLLDCLEQIKDELDGTLAFRRSCREGICGSCAVRIDGRSALACRTPAPELTSGDRGDAVPVIAPIGNLPLVRDLVVDMEPMWEKMRLIEPFLRPRREPEQAGKEAFAGVRKEALCIDCGACVSECDAISVSPEFLGPHALARAWRFLGDPREGETVRRLKALSGEHGIWECTRCYLCNERCPKGVDPRDAIAKLGAEAIAAAIRRDRGARHARWFVTSARTTGWLRESELVLRTLGLVHSIGKIPLAVRLFRHGKAPLPLPRHKADDLEVAMELRRLVSGQERRGAKGIIQGERALELAGLDAPAGGASGEDGR